MDETNGKTNCSADVDMWMDCDGHGKVPLAQASSTFVVAATAVDVPPCDARIVLTVDGERFDRRVRLVNGISTDRKDAIVVSESTGL